MAKGRKTRKRAVNPYMEPTPEQFDGGTFERAGLAYRRVPVIDTLSQTGKLTARQHQGLARYRDIAIADERSPIRDSLDKAMQGRGGGDGMPPAQLRNAIELGRLERELGSLYDIARAVAVDDVTPSQWAMRQSGSVARMREGPLRKVVTWFEPRRKALEIAMMEIQMAGERLAGAIGA